MLASCSPRYFKTQAATVCAAGLLLGLAACATNAVTGGRDATSDGSQSETDAATSYHQGVHRIVVTYNDETGSAATIKYAPNSRQVLRGASLGGWSYSENQGTSWKYGGKLSPPPGWAVLWGDPAIVTSRANYGVVFISNLAFPDAKFPNEGISGSVFSAVGGACIFRSLDGGVSFRAFQCLTDKSPVPGVDGSINGHFFDGGSLAAAPNGDIFAAYVDVDTSQIVVYRSAGGRTDFTPLPRPFPDLYVGSHPRIRVGYDGTLFAMAIAKATSGPNATFMLMVNRFQNGTWDDAKPIAGAANYPEVDLNSSLLGAPLRIRTGPQFSFDVGARSEFTDDSIRFLVTQYNSNGWLFVRGGVCSYDLNACGWLQGWTFGAQTISDRVQRIDVFNPNVIAFPGMPFATGPRWQGSFLTRYGNTTTALNLTRATLGYLNGSPFSIPVDLGRNRPVCSDKRGYWGDYDAHLYVWIQGDSVRFMRFMTDSSGGCTERSDFMGRRQHVSAFSYDY